MMIRIFLFNSFEYFLFRDCIGDWDFKRKVNWDCYFKGHCEPEILYNNNNYFTIQEVFWCLFVNF